MSGVHPPSRESVPVPPISNRPRRARRFRQLTMRTAVVLAIITAITCADWWLRNREMDHLVTAVERSERVTLAAAEGFARELRAVDASSSLTSAQAESLRRSLTQHAANSAAQVLTTGDQVRDVTVLPWHRSIQTAKRRYLAHSDTWRTFLTAASRDVAEVSKPRPEIQGTYRSAQIAFSDAVPIWPMNNLGERVSRAFRG